MRPRMSVIITIIFLFLLANKTRGSTVEKQENIETRRTSNKMESEGVVVSQGQSQCLGKARKLLMKSPIVPTKDKLTKQGSSSTRDDPQTDVLDIAGMDYSPAKRKPPIHN